ncbi:MAG: hypothetical protein ABIH26_11820 [Candidatus Eisenbacteria bacterium]
MFELFALFVLIAVFVLAVKVLGLVLHILFFPLKILAGLLFGLLLLPIFLLALPFLLIAGVGAVLGMGALFFLLVAGGIAAIL